MRTTWNCDICNKNYREFKDAEECEKKHVLPSQITGYHFPEGVLYPQTITVGMKDGKKATYTYHSGLI